MTIFFSLFSSAAQNKLVSHCYQKYQYFFSAGGRLEKILSNLISFHCFQQRAHNKPGLILFMYWTTLLIIIPFGELEVKLTHRCYCGGIRLHVQGLQPDVMKGQEVVTTFWRRWRGMLAGAMIHEWKSWLRTSMKWRLYKTPKYWIYPSIYI